MTKSEVKSLNDLAMAHGGHLTINPHTGLPEAGILSSLLPTVLGFGLNAAFPGLGQIGSSLISGAIGMAMNPKGGLMGGLMAGLGAYGGAGLGESLAKSGMEQATQAELAKNTAFQEAQTTAQAKAADLGNVAQKQIAENAFKPGEFATQAQGITAPLNDMRATALSGQQAAYGDMGMGDKLKMLGNTIGSEEGRSGFMNNIGGGMGLAKTGLMAAAPLIANSMNSNNNQPKQAEDKDMGQRYTYSPNMMQGPYTSSPTGVEQRYFNPAYTPVSADKAKSIYGFADGGLSESDFNLGGYSDGGRLLRGPGDGVSDSIPATIGHKQPARLADGEFVVPARIVSELGNGSTEAGARKLYAMMDRIQSARSKTVGEGKLAKNSRSEKYLPA